MYNELAAEIHADNVKAGWWTDLTTGLSILDSRNVGEMIALIHSEISEGQFGWINDVNDDKLTHRSMFEVEIADVAIRTYDLAGSRNVDLDRLVPELMVDKPLQFYDTCLEDCAEFHYRVDAFALEGFRKNKWNKNYDVSEFHYGLALIIATCELFAEKYGLELTETIAEKRAFNANREDHKVENRLKDDGKKI